MGRPSEIAKKVKDLDILFEDVKNMEKNKLEKKYGFNGRSLRYFLKTKGYITNTKSHEQIDHKNTKRNDNRKLNLRFCTASENARNKRPRKCNKTGFVGVSLRENGTYRVRILVEGREKTIGHFKDIKDAVKARLLAERKYYKEFAPQYYLFEEYGIDENE